MCLGCMVVWTLRCTSAARCRWYGWAHEAPSDISLISSLPLPSGWEKAVTEDGDIYYIKCVCLLLMYLAPCYSNLFIPLPTHSPLTLHSFSTRSHNELSTHWCHPLEREPGMLLSVHAGA